MPTVWLSLKKSLDCRSDPQDVYKPGSTRGIRSRSIANQVKDALRGSKSIMHNVNSSPCSIASDDFSNNMSKEDKLLRNSAAFETKITNGRAEILSPITHGSLLMTPPKHLPPSVASYRKASRSVFHGPGAQLINEACICLKCSQRCMNAQGLQAHRLTNHGVTELKEGDSTRNIVEIIFKSSWIDSGIECGKIERILKVNNTQKTLARYEDYRETVKSKASKLPKKHPRCSADGNEVLRFHGTTIMCSLGSKGFSSVCTFLECNVCNIIRTGFLSKGLVKGKAIYTASTSLRAHKSSDLCEPISTMFPVKRAMLVCRVIAGRVHKPLNNSSSTASYVPVGYDSVAGDGGVDCKLEELYVSNPRAVLPCFLVVYS